MTPALVVIGLAGCTSTPRGTPVSRTPSPVRSSSPGSASGTRTPTPSPSPSFDRGAFSIDDPRSLWVVVDKHRPLSPRTYAPPDLVTPSVLHTNPPRLRREAAAAVERMFAGAEADGVRLVSTSTYRSYSMQQQILASDTATMGAARADSMDMRPG